MATVTGMTAEAMSAIRDGAIVGADFDSANHLILTKYDGTQIDAGVIGTATTTLQGVVELATSAETQTGTDATRAVTPAGLASIPGYKVQIVSGIAESATPAVWPYGVSLQSVASADAWSLNSSSGTVITESVVTDRTVQTFYASSGGTTTVKAWTRSYHSTTGGGGWTAWAQLMLMPSLDPTAFTQATTRGNYPLGQSRLYYTAGSAGSWDFSALAPGEVITYIENDNTFGRQEFVQHAGGSTNPVKWFRTANAAGGWTAWQKVLVDPGAWISYTPTWTTDSGVHLPALGNATVNCKYQKIGRTVNVKFSISFGSSTNFGSGATSSDNWVFSLPVTAADSTTDTLGWMDGYQSSTVNGLFRAKMSGTGAFKMNISAGSTSGIGSDVDSTQPFTWASGNTLRGFLTYESAA